MHGRVDILICKDDIWIANRSFEIAEKWKKMQIFFYASCKKNMQMVKIHRC